MTFLALHNRILHFTTPIRFIPTGILSVIDKVKLSSSTGVKDINSKILTNTTWISSLILSLIFSQPLRTGRLPEDWEVGKVTPIFKSGKKDSPVNYRPISLTRVPCKIVGHIIYSNHFLGANNFFHPAQHGFPKGYS